MVYLTVSSNIEIIALPLRKEVFLFKNMATGENCSSYNTCGFIKYLKGIKGMSNPDCEKKPETCGRLDPAIPFNLETELPVSDEELKTAFPVFDDQKPQRILRGTHN